MSSNLKKKYPPQLNKFMHPRNPYKNYPSFKELASLYPDFRSHCTYDISGKVYLDFKNAKALKALTTCLLDKDFNLKVNIPEDRLVPTLPLRLNYLLWIEDLLKINQIKCTQENENKSIIGIDIGTGATCIYPLLGVRKFGWKFIALETDDLSFQSSKSNLIKNELQDSVLLLKTELMFEALEEEACNDFIKKIKNEDFEEKMEVDDRLKHSTMSPNNYSVDFSMCNPPFFSSDVEMDTNHNSKKSTRSQPTSISTGASHERVTEGGELAFIKKMIKMSLVYKDKIRIFSTLIGRQIDVKNVMKIINEECGHFEINICDTEFCQGRTMRWGVAWTFDKNLTLDRVASTKKKMTQKPLTVTVPKSLMPLYNVHNVWSKVLEWLKVIKIKPHVFKENKFYVGATVWAYKPTWQNQRKKRREKLNQTQALSPVKYDEVDTSDDVLENPFKKIKLDSSSELKPTPTKTEGSAQSSQVPEVSHSDGSHNTFLLKGKECLLKCIVHLKHINGVITIETNYIDGTGKKEAMNQLLQYLKNKMVNEISRT